jgi:hypothetical protein
MKKHEFKYLLQAYLDEKWETVFSFHLASDKERLLNEQREYHPDWILRVIKNYRYENSRKVQI